MSTPRVRSPSRISLVSRASSPLVMVDGPDARAARTRARLVSDFDPGTSTVARIGAGAIGAGQGPAAGRVRSSGVLDTAGESTRETAARRPDQFSPSWMFSVAFCADFFT